MANFLTMSAKALAATTVLLLAGLGAATTADADQPAAKCKTVSSQTQTQAGSTGVLHRTVTVTRCHGKLITSYTAWS